MRELRRFGLAGAFALVPVFAGCSDGERIATGAVIGALAGVALGSIDDSDVRVHTYSYYGTGYGSGRWGEHTYGSGYGSRYGWYGSTRYGHRDDRWRWRSYPYYPRARYRCDY